jgi:exopolysaccharide biosynthesis polyprenyl glycosylphosphotransferase
MVERAPAPRMESPARRRLWLVPPAPEGITEGVVAQPIRGRDGLYRRGLALADTVAALIALGAVATISHRPGGLLLVALAPAIVLVNKIAGLYDRDELVLNKTTLDEAPGLLQISGLFTLLVWMSHAAVSAAGLDPTGVLMLWAGLLGLTLVGRTAARRAARAWSGPERCLVIGSADALEQKLRSAHAEVVDRIDAGVGNVAAHPDQLRARVRRHDVHRIVIAPADSDAGDVLELIRIAKAAGVRVSVLPRMLEVVGSSVEFDQIDGLTMLGVRSFGLSRSSRALKRAFDLAAGGIMLIAVAPIMAAIALAIRLDSPGGVLFRQTRIGRDGQPFEIFKFRSMSADAEERKRELLHLNETDGLFKIAADPRVTRIGRFIRSTSLDELPQLLNVVRGEMSLVGPRPLVVDEDAKVAGLDRARLHLTPGMTGHWQILGSARVPLDEMVGIDYLYVANWSLWTDIKILLRTVRYVFSRGGV